MNYLLVRHKVADFSKWKAAYDAHSPARQKAGIAEKYLLRNTDPGTLRLCRGDAGRFVVVRCCLSYLTSPNA